MSADLLPPDQSHPYWSADHPDHGKAVQEVESKLRAAYAEPSGDLASAEGVSGSTLTPAEPPQAPVPHTLDAPPGDAYDADTISDCGATAAEVGLSREAAQGLLYTHAVGQDPLTGLPEYHGTPEAAEGALRREWGQEYDARVSLAQWAAEGCGEHVLDALGTTGLGNDPRVIRFFAREGARASIRAIMSDPKHPYYNGSSPDHREAVERITWLFRVAGRP
jgi:hypothetical protein